MGPASIFESALASNSSRETHVLRLQTEAQDMKKSLRIGVDDNTYFLYQQGLLAAGTHLLGLPIKVEGNRHFVVWGRMLESFGIRKHPKRKRLATSYDLRAFKEPWLVSFFTILCVEPIKQDHDSDAN